MYKSVFTKYFSVISLIIVISFLMMSLLQAVLFTRSISEEKRALLLENAENIANHTERAATQSHVLENGVVSYALDTNKIEPFFAVIADAVDATVFMTNTDGVILMSSEGNNSPFIGKTEPGKLIAGHTEPRFAISDINGMFDQKQYVGIAPVRINNHVLGYVLVVSPATTVFYTLSSHFQIYLMSAVGALIVSSVVVYVLCYRFVRPLKQMASVTRHFANGDFSVRVKVRGKDEVAELGNALNHMATSLSSVETMRRSFVGNISHELKTPMTTIAGFVDGILDGTIPPEKEKQYLKIVSDEVKRLSRLVRSMLEISRIDSGELKINKVRFDLMDIIAGVLLSSEQRIEKKSLTITGLEDEESFEVDGDYDLMNQVLYNLVDNAIKFTNEGGQIDIRLQKTDKRILCTIRNTGDGIPAQEMPQIFERFYKSDRSRSLDKNGMGIGLYIVKTVIGLHDGEISVRSVQNEFTEFIFWLPKPPEELPTGTVE